MFVLKKFYREKKSQISIKYILIFFHGVPIILCKHNLNNILFSLSFGLRIIYDDVTMCDFILENNRLNSDEQVEKLTVDRKI